MQVKQNLELNLSLYNQKGRNNMIQYLGITIGPIFETIELADSPAKMWFASTVFSDLTRRLCKELKTEFGDNVTIISPYYDDTISLRDGVGKFHDRIICRLEDVLELDLGLKKILEKAKKETADVFESCNSNGFSLNSAQKAFLEKYLQIRYVIVEESEQLKQGEDNVMIKISEYLDALELMENFPPDNRNHAFIELFKGQENSPNAYVRKSSLLGQVEKPNQLQDQKDDSIWTVEEIANNKGQTKSNLNKSNLKKYKYYAVVSADGDRMGEFLKGLGNDIHKLSNFSKTCLEYAQKASKLIGEFGGMTIYAGGDDLLFLAPVENERSESILDLCGKISKEFTTLFSGNFQESNTPSVSFGVAIQHIKYPLYEAFKRARQLLEEAKSGEKNKVMLELQKHSGQKFRFKVSNNKLGVLQDFITDTSSSGVQKETTVHAIIYRLSQIQPILQVLDSRLDTLRRNDLEAIWMNFFDNPNQEASEDYIKKIAGFYFNEIVFDSLEMALSNRVSPDSEKNLFILQCILRYKKFLIEKGNE